MNGVIADLLATSKRSISHLRYDVDLANAREPSSGRLLDFGGNLRDLRLHIKTEKRYPLSTGRLDSWAGVRGLSIIKGSLPEARIAELYRIVGPTLESLEVCGNSNEWDEEASLGELTGVTHLELDDGRMHPYFSFPPNLTHLTFRSDADLLDMLHRWQSTPPILPLQEITIPSLIHKTTLQLLPSTEILSAMYTRPLKLNLQALRPGVVRFEALKILPGSFRWTLARAEALEMECKRLGIKLIGED